MRRDASPGEQEDGLLYTRLYVHTLCIRHYGLFAQNCAVMWVPKLRLTITKKFTTLQRVEHFSTQQALAGEWNKGQEQPHAGQVRLPSVEY